MNNYVYKMRTLLWMQRRTCSEGYETYCAISGAKILPVMRGDVFYDVLTNSKLDFCHVLSNTHSNRKHYPHFIDSILNGVVGLHNAHLSSSCSNYPPENLYTDREIYKIEFYLSADIAENQMVRAVLNGEMHTNDLMIKHYIDKVHKYIGRE